MIIRKWLYRSNLYETLQQHDVFWEKSIQFHDINDFETNRNQTNTQRLKKSTEMKYFGRNNRNGFGQISVSNTSTCLQLSAVSRPPELALHYANQ